MLPKQPSLGIPGSGGAGGGLPKHPSLGIPGGGGGGGLRRQGSGAPWQDAAQQPKLHPQPSKASSLNSIWRQIQQGSGSAAPGSPQKEAGGLRRQGTAAGSQPLGRQGTVWKQGTLQQQHSGPRRQGTLAKEGGGVWRQGTLSAEGLRQRKFSTVGQQRAAEAALKAEEVSRGGRRAPAHSSRLQGWCHHACHGEFPCLHGA